MASDEDRPDRLGVPAMTWHVCPDERAGRPGDRRGEGIGRAIAEAFAEQGERVAVHYGHSAAALAAEVLAGLPGSGHAAVRADLADPEAVRTMVGRPSRRLAAWTCW